MSVLRFVPRIRKAAEWLLSREGYLGIGFRRRNRPFIEDGDRQSRDELDDFFETIQGLCSSSELVDQ